MEFSKETRRLAIEKMQDRQLDLLIIGGGITGAGVALQAAASGMETGLIEMQDFAEGTSSRSTKLVHGGLRYLKQFDVEVVSDTVSERAVVQQIAPHIPKPDPMLLPVYDEEGSTFSLFRLKVAMDLYDLLAGVNNTDLANKVLTKEEVLEREPHLKQEGLLGGGVYLDYRNNDARLVIENIKRAAKDGALIASRVKAESFIKDEAGKVVGIVARDLLTDNTFEIRARLVINTTGPWSDEVRNLGGEGSGILQMRPTKGFTWWWTVPAFQCRSQPILIQERLMDAWSSSYLGRIRPILEQRIQIILAIWPIQRSPKKTLITSWPSSTTASLKRT